MQIYKWLCSFIVDTIQQLKGILIILWYKGLVSHNTPKCNGDWQLPNRVNSVGNPSQIAVDFVDSKVDS